MPHEESKEILNQLFGEEVPVVEVGKEKMEIPPETHLEKIEGELHVLPTVRDGWGRVLAQPPTKPQVKITLPLSKGEYLAAWSQPFTEAIRWMAVWIKRILKIFPERVRFGEAKANTI